MSHFLFNGVDEALQLFLHHVRETVFDVFLTW